jgi:hypothetical protein
MDSPFIAMLHGPAHSERQELKEFFLHVELVSGMAVECSLI